MNRTIIKTGLIFCLLVISCNKDESSSSDRLVGTWALIDQSSRYIITTNSDQTILNPYEKGEGGTYLTGAEEATLTLLRTFSVVPDEESVVVNNSSISEKYYTLTLRERTLANSVDLFVNEFNSDYSDRYYGTAEFSFDGETIVISDGIMVNQEQDTVWVSGELTGVIVFIPANTETPINLRIIADSDVNETLIINGNNTYVRTHSFFDDMYISEGEWSTNNDQITFTYESEDTTIHSSFSYSIANDILTLKEDEKDPCLDLDISPGWLECFELYEMMFSLDTASIESIKTSSVKEYERIPVSVAMGVPMNKNESIHLYESFSDQLSRIIIKKQKNQIG
ncbi:MAG: hypothetical protein GWP19_04310 [Planctomycetia bacterium]|nr:hypothetical protein [Planctomycetia bacterium]